MGMSVYYTAKRDMPLTAEEKQQIQAAADQYNAEYPFQNKHEDFCIYSEPLDEPDAVFAGATRIPMNRKLFYDIILYWLKCLTKITRLLKGCTWDARLDEVKLIWEEENGWRLPTDAEYREQKREQSKN